MSPLIYSLAVVIADQATKYIARIQLSHHDSISVLGNFFRLTYVENSGIAFGINFEGGSVLFTVLHSIATVVVFGYLWASREKGFPFRFSLALILGGAVGNLTDRFIFGKVVDFFHFSIGQYSWPVFNVADSSVTVGMILFLYISIFRSGESQVAA
ncbi:MAG: signal peptidase II [Candidatus Marinimicrobia bacterium]|nr:signal peptidase II [Candidatus Neomarinimicrobiota bacterium]MDP6593684.1 signal peptidase II [Candidatus Neomarinimicrobiota bacterium]MDP6836361.1 signal peptidase II [Candidatus Neomarinimicrobiota bacterium]MDP6967211.1 signal peptidase II [Candidatus Neomarinimicrobiota bacterium]